MVRDVRAWRVPDDDRSIRARFPTGTQPPGLQGDKVMADDPGLVMRPAMVQPPIGDGAINIDTGVSLEWAPPTEAQANLQDKLVGRMFPNASWLRIRFPAMSSRLSFSGQKVYQDRRHANRFLPTFRYPRIDGSISSRLKAPPRTSDGTHTKILQDAVGGFSRNDGHTHRSGYEGCGPARCLDPSVRGDLFNRQYGQTHCVSMLSRGGTETLHRPCLGLDRLWAWGASA
jgi:hypothetical protein